MPRYYFDIRGSDGGLVPDEKGITLPDVGAAHTKAVTRAHDLAVDEYRRTGTVDGRKVEIVGETGDFLDDVAVRDAIKPWGAYHDQRTATK